MFKIPLPGSNPPSVQKREHQVSIHSSDLRRMGVVMVPQTVTKTESATMGGSMKGEEVMSKRQAYHPGEPHAKKRFPPGMKTGGLVKETGVYTLHKGEVVVPASRVKSVDMSLKKDKKKPLKK